jgi:hypothetical protein
MTQATPTSPSPAPLGSTTTAPVTQTTVAVPTTDPGPAPAPGVSSAGLAGAIISGAFLAAMVAGAINVWMARRRSREEERARIRTTFAAAFEAYTAYKEFPYAIRRRRADDPKGERIRLDAIGALVGLTQHRPSDRNQGEGCTREKRRRTSP